MHVKESIVNLKSTLPEIILKNKQTDNESEKRVNHKWLTEKDRLKWKEDWKKKTEEASDFAKKMSGFQKEIRKRSITKQKMLSEKLRKEEDEKLKMEIEEQKVIEAKKKEIASKKLEDTLAKREERNKLLEYAKHSPKNKVYLYKKMAEQHQNEIEAIEQERKQLIVNKHEMYKSIRLKNLRSLNRSLDESMQKHKEERRDSLNQQKRNEKMYMSLVNKKYKTFSMEQVIKKEKDVKEQREALALLPKEAYMKRLEYAKIVSKFNLSSLRSPKSPSKEEMKGIKKFLRKRSSLERIPYKYKLKLKKPKNNTNETATSNHTKSRLTNKGKIIDYLKEMRSHNTQRKHNSFLYDKSLSKQDKHEILKSRMEVIQESIDLKEKLLSVNKGNINVEQEISDMYIEAIKAKLHLFELINNN